MQSSGEDSLMIVLMQTMIDFVVSYFDFHFISRDMCLFALSNKSFVLGYSGLDL